jgi:isocitrate/isopropylmalate dehydrogenase
MDIAGQNKANPLGLLAGATMMLRYMDLAPFAERIESAVGTVISEKKVNARPFTLLRLDQDIDRDLPSLALCILHLG